MAKTIEIPSYDDFWEYFTEKMRKKKDDPNQYSEWLEDKYEAWLENDWQKEKQGKSYPIKNWKSTLLQCLSYRMPNKVKDTKVRAEILKPTGKLMEIENEIIIGAFNHYKVMCTLPLKYEESFDILLERGVFKKGTEMSEKTGKPWQEWYDKLFEKARVEAIRYSAQEKWSKPDQGRVMRGEDPIISRFVKLEALKTFFDRFENEGRLKKAL